MSNNDAALAAAGPLSPPAPEWAPFLASKRASRARRRIVARALQRRRVGRRAGALLAATMLMAVGAAVAHESKPRAAAATHGAGLLRIGSNGPQVAALQRALGVPADGDFGPQTRRAVRRAQRRHGLPVDGIAGPATLSALRVTPVAAAPVARLHASIGAVEGARGARLLRRIAECESGGNPAAVGGGGRYRGKYQFTRATWRALGGSGDPAKAPEAEQDRVAMKLLAREGTSPWPACGV